MANFSVWFMGIILLILCSDSKAVVNKNKIPLFKMSLQYQEPSYDDFSSRIISDIISDQSQLLRPDNDDPCESYIPPKSKFWDGGLRLSDRKCSEYIADMVNQDIIKDREERCRQKHGKASGTTHIRLMKKHSTKEGEYPHMAAFGWRTKRRNSWTFLCGGSLISNRFVLTAAHCASQSSKEVTKYLAKAQPEIVRLGSRYIKKRFNPATDVKIKQFIQHPFWDSPKHYYDIALVELTEAVSFSNLVRPACLPGSFPSKYDAYITGWGVTDETSKTLSSVLQSAEVDIIDSSECNSLLKSFSSRKWWGVMDHQMCAGKLEGGVDTCQGDSGGPLQLKLRETKYEGTMHMVIGVTSFGFKCGIKNQPGIYTRVSSFVDWIESTVWPQ